jgi:hypothetical protein
MPDPAARVEPATLDDVRVLGRRLGWELTEEEALALLPGVNRNLRMALEARSWIPAEPGLGSPAGSHVRSNDADSENAR